MYEIFLNNFTKKVPHQLIFLTALVRNLSSLVYGARQRQLACLKPLEVDGLYDYTLFLKN